LSNKADADQENNSIHNSFKKIKIPKNKFNEDVTNLYNENYKSLEKELKKDIRRWKDIHSMLMDYQNQYWENVYTTESNLYVKIPMTFFH
jgi:hypothetical protein